MVGTKRNAREKLNANSKGTFIEIRDKDNSLGSTVRKNRENEDIIMIIRIIIAME